MVAKRRSQNTGEQTDTNRSRRWAQPALHMNITAALRRWLPSLACHVVNLQCDVVHSPAAITRKPPILVSLRVLICCCHCSLYWNSYSACYEKSIQANMLVAAGWLNLATVTSEQCCASTSSQALNNIALCAGTGTGLSQLLTWLASSYFLTLAATCAADAQWALAPSVQLKCWRLR